MNVILMNSEGSEVYDILYGASQPPRRGERVSVETDTGDPDFGTQVQDYLVLEVTWAIADLDKPEWSAYVAVDKVDRKPLPDMNFYR